MAIPLETPITIQPTEPKVFDSVWITSFVANFPSAEEAKGKSYLRIESKPYNTTTKEILNVEPTVISSDDLWNMIHTIPEVQAAFGYILNAIPAIREYTKPVVSSEPIVEPEPVTEPMSMLDRQNLTVVKPLDKVVEKSEEKVWKEFGDFLDNKSDLVDGKFVKKSWWKRFLDFWNKDIL